jgi:hypothetical protein
MLHWNVHSFSPVPLTLEEHRELSREVLAINVRIQELAKMVVEVYGPQNQAAFTFQKTAELMARLCQDLRAQAARDLTGATTDGLYLR